MKPLLILLMFVLPIVLFAESSKNFIRDGNKMYNKGKYNDAEVQYRKSLESNPKSAKAQYNLGNSLFKQDKYGEATEKYIDLTNKKLDKQELAATYHNLGNSYLKDKKYKESIDAYKNALRNSPNDLDTKYNLEYARKMMMIQQQQQQQKQNQQQNKDQQKQQKQQQQQQQQDKQQEQKKEQQQQQKQQKISKEDADRMLKALSGEEKKLQKDLKKKQVGRGDKSILKKW